MLKFTCSYAHDISCYADFVVEAETEKAALRKIKKALRKGRFDQVETTPCWENGSIRPRVFVQGVAKEHSPTTTLEELIGQDHLFSASTKLCVRCGKSAEDDLIENQPCTPQLTTKT
jgi:hypothetical protein